MEVKDIRIAYFIDRIIAGGTELQLVEQINRLEEIGIKQILFCLYKSNEHDHIPVSCHTEILDIRSLIAIGTLKKFIKVVKFLRTEKINFVQTYFFDSTFFGILCARFASVRWRISCRRDLGFWYTGNLLFFLKRINVFTHRILVNSYAVKKAIMQTEKVPDSTVDIIRNGINTGHFKFNLQQRIKSRQKLRVTDFEVCLGMIANMSRQVKRVDLFIKAAAILTAKRLPVKFFIQGSGYLKFELEKLAQQYDLENHLFFLDGEIDNRTLLAAMDIGVIASDSEGFSNALMEYMASGAAVVASDVGGNRELIRPGENGLLFTKGEARDLAAKIEALIENSRYRKIGKRGARDILLFDWSCRIPQILNYYVNLLDFSK